MSQKRSEETRNQIMAAAVDLFCRLGYDATGVAQICSQAGISKGAFYHHFPSKKALFLAILEAWLQGLNSDLFAFRATDKTVPQSMQEMANSMGAVFRVAGGQLPMFLEFMIQASRDQVVWDTTIAPFQRYQALFAGLIDEGRQEGSIKNEVDAGTAAWVLIAFAVGTLLQGAVMPEAVDWEKVAGQGMRMILESMQRGE
jgi:AcrR family transcriptional regulator